jgi:hypothetical protein
MKVLMKVQMIVNVNVARKKNKNPGVKNANVAVKRRRCIVKKQGRRVYVINLT